MFNSIAKSYDFLNHFLTFGIDIYWRKKLINELLFYRPEYVLDIATGTGDLAIMAAKRGVKRIVGVDLSDEMVAIGKHKLERRSYGSKVLMSVGDAENLCFNTGSFDAVMVAFGVRNFENLDKGLLEINRVLKVGQPVFILEFSKPRIFLIKHFFNFYSNKFLPFIGKIISKDKRAYTYLPESIDEFPSGDEFLTILSNNNFENCLRIPLTFERVTLYIGHKMQK